MKSANATAFKLAVMYALVAGLWLALFSWIEVAVVYDPSLCGMIEVGKSVVLILLTAVFLYFVLRSRIETAARFRTAHRESESERNLSKESLRVRNAELSALFEFSSYLRYAKNSDELVPIVLERVCELFGVIDAAITLLAPDRGRFDIVRGTGVWEDVIGQSFPTDKGLSGRVLETGEPQITGDYGMKEWAVTIDGEAHKLIGPAIAVPLKSEQDVIGALIVGRRRNERWRPFAHSEVNVLSTIGEMIGLAFRRMNLAEDAQRRLRRTEALRNIDMAITGSLDLRVTFRVILDEVMGQLGVDGSAILRRSPFTRGLTYVAWRGLKSARPQDLSRAIDQGLAKQVVDEGRVMHVPRLDDGELEPEVIGIMTLEGYHTCYASPLIVKGQVRGILEVYLKEEGSKDADWEGFLEILAGQAAVAIDNAELFHNLERSNIELMEAYDATLQGWSFALSLKEDETARHSRRTTEMTLRIARELGIDEEDLVHVRRGAFLHDIGKMGVPDSVLLKPGKLTDEEWEIMREHPVHAFKMLARIDYLRPALDIPYCHHEKWDGTGYPRGLKEDEIPLAARIFAVADVWDALSSARPYREAWSDSAVISHIQEQAGTHFDPKVVDAFLKIIHEELPTAEESE